MGIGIVVLLAIVASLLVLQRRFYAVQYLFFLRYPVVFAALLIVGPFLALTSARGLLGNLFALDGVGIAIVSGLGFFVASTTVYTFGLTFSLTPARTRLRFQRPGQLALPTASGGPSSASESSASSEAQAGEGRARRWTDRLWPADGDWHAQLVRLLDRWHFGLSAALSAPLLIVLARESPLHWTAAASIGVLGVAAASLGGYWASRDIVRAASSGLDVAFTAVRAIGSMNLGALAGPVRWFVSLFDDGFESDQDPGLRPHYHAVLFFVVSAVLYAVLGGLLDWSFDSKERVLADAVPALAYILILMMVLGWLLSFLAFFFDKYRVPPSLVLLGAWGISYGLGAKDHYFGIVQAHADTPLPVPAPTRCELSPVMAFDAWHEQQPKEKKPTLVVVAVSGGGITASLWTARVLTALAAEPRLGPDFARSIGLISSASGGGVGAAYFVDAYAPGSVPGSDPAVLDRIVEAAGASSLHDTAYALAYSDLFRVIAPIFVGPESQDRGLALERSWQRWLSHPDLELSDWRAGVRAGWRPPQIFNVTIAETGERMLFGPVDCPTAACKGPWRGQSMLDLYGASGDLRVVTAARLSATFPWVTPLSRASVGQAYHLADGGYYDNFGVVTLIEWLTSLQAQGQGLKDRVEKVLVVQVRASEHVRGKPREDDGWLYATIGPVLTMMNVRTTSQRNHNEAHLLALDAILAHQGVAFEAVDFELAGETPLSWHLTPEDRSKIKNHWTESPTIRQKLDTLICLWSQAPARWKQECGTEDSIRLNEPDAGAEIFRQAREKAEIAEAQVQQDPVPL